MSSAKAENCDQRFVDTPKLLMGQVPDQRPQSIGVYGANLFYENSRGLALNLRLGPE